MPGQNLTSNQLGWLAAMLCGTMIYCCGHTQGVRDRKSEVRWNEGQSLDVTPVLEGSASHDAATWDGLHLRTEIQAAVQEKFKELYSFQEVSDKWVPVGKNWEARGLHRWRVSKGEEGYKAGFPWRFMLNLRYTGVGSPAAASVLIQFYDEKGRPNASIVDTLQAGQRLHQVISDPYKEENAKADFVHIEVVSQ